MDHRLRGRAYKDSAAPWESLKPICELTETSARFHLIHSQLFLAFQIRSEQVSTGWTKHPDSRLLLLDVGFQNEWFA